MTDRELMQMALDEIEHALGATNVAQKRIDDLKHALQNRLAQPEPEPVARMYVNTDGECEQIEFGDPIDDPSVTLLYTVPPKREWVGLEDKDVATVKNEFNRGALWAEQILKEKNV